MDSFNINDEVWVRLTERGLDEIRKGAGGGMALHRYRAEIGGWTRWQLWELMEALGRFCYMGGRLPFETEVRWKPPNLDRPKCDECGELAVESCVDVARWPNYESGNMECAPLGPVKHGCLRHPVKSETHDFMRKP